MQKIKTSLMCPCGSGQKYACCCQKWHQGVQYLQAPTAELLMRSRYSAFVLDLREYLLKTWHPITCPTSIDPPEAGMKWLGLDIHKVHRIDATQAYVEFTARYRIQGRAYKMRELSKFEKKEGLWLYVDAQDDAATTQP